MAQRRIVTLVDDTDETPADETIALALDGVSYEIDLSLSNAAELRGTMKPWVDSARRTGGRRRRGTPR